MHERLMRLMVEEGDTRVDEEFLRIEATDIKNPGFVNEVFASIDALPSEDTKDSTQ